VNHKERRTGQHFRALGSWCGLREQANYPSQLSGRQEVVAGKSPDSLAVGAGPSQKPPWILVGRAHSVLPMRPREPDNGCDDGNADDGVELMEIFS